MYIVQDIKLVLVIFYEYLLRENYHKLYAESEFWKIFKAVVLEF